MKTMSNQRMWTLAGLLALICVAVALIGCTQLREGPVDESPLIDRSPVSEPTEPGPVVDHVREGDELLQARRYEQAIEAYDEAIEKGADLARAYAGRGQAYAALRRFREAVTDYDKSLEYDRTADVLASRCNASRLLARSDEAMTNCQEAISLDPENVDARLALAMLYLDQNSPEEARSEIEAAREIDPGSAKAHYVLAQVEVAEGKYEAAVASLTRCIEIDPSQPRYYWDRGFIHYSLGKIDQAKEDLYAVIELGNPETDGELLFNAGQLLRSLGEEP